MVSKKMVFGAGTLVLLLALLVWCLLGEYTMMRAAGGSAGPWNDYRAADALVGWFWRGRAGDLSR